MQEKNQVFWSKKKKTSKFLLIIFRKLIDYLIFVTNYRSTTSHVTKLLRDRLSRVLLLLLLLLVLPLDSIRDNNLRNWWIYSVKHMDR